MFSSKFVELQSSHGVWVQAALREGLTPKVINLFTQTWKPVLEQMQAPDAHWDWPGFWRDYRREKSQFLSLECQSDLQGLAWFDLSGISSRIGQALPLVYVQRVSVAPWNRTTSGRRRFRPVGLILIREAVELSMDLGWGGRIGLHSLPTAADWYRGVLRMTPVTVNDVEHENLDYFEFTAEQAVAFLEPTQ